MLDWNQWNEWNDLAFFEAIFMQMEPAWLTYDLLHSFASTPALLLKIIGSLQIPSANFLHFWPRAPSYMQKLNGIMCFAKGGGDFPCVTFPIFRLGQKKSACGSWPPPLRCTSEITMLILFGLCIAMWFAPQCDLCQKFWPQDFYALFHRRRL